MYRKSTSTRYQQGEGNKSGARWLDLDQESYVRCEWPGPKPFRIRTRVCVGLCDLKNNCAINLCSGDQIEYFRKKAKDERWHEVCETIHAELFNYRRGCQAMEAAWSKSAVRPLTNSDGYHWSFGHVSYARRQAALYKQLYQQCDKVVKSCKLEELPEGGILSDVIGRQRREAAEKDRKYIADMIATIDSLAKTVLDT